MLLSERLGPAYSKVELHGIPMPGVQTVEPSIMSFTDDAANKVQNLISEEATGCT